MTAALKLEQDPLDEVIILLSNARGIAASMRLVSGKRREAALRVLHTYVAVAADRAFALIPRPPVTRKPDHAWLSSGGLVHAFPRDDGGTYTRSSCGGIKKRRGEWFITSGGTRCKNCARMVAG